MALLQRHKERSTAGYQKNVLPLLKWSGNHITVGVSIHMSAPSLPDGPAWPTPVRSAGASAANRRKTVSGCQTDDPVIAKRNVTLKAD